MKFEEMALDQIEEAAYNPRERLEPGDPRFERLKQSIDHFGSVEPLVWNKKTKRLVGGHQRLYVMRELGLETAWVSVVDLDEDDEKALNVALNNPNLQSDWNPQALIQLAESMPEDLLKFTGFDSTAEAQEILRRAEISHETSFLETYLQKPTVPPSDPAQVPEMGGDSGDGEQPRERKREIDMKEDHPHRSGQQVFEVTLVLTPEQRAIYFQAVDRAKRSFSTDNSFEAVTEIMAAYNREWEAKHADAGVDA